MIDAMKYIIVRDRDDEEHAIVFPDKITHKDVARIHRASDVRVVSAGFCRIGDQCQVWGQSDSLRMCSRPEDAAIINADWLAEAPGQGQKQIVERQDLEDNDEI